MGTSSKLKTASIWTASILLAVLFVVTGAPKLLGAEGWVRHFARWGYPDWLRLVIGSLEVAAAALLCIPKLATLGACVIVVVMAGATYTHLFRAPDEVGRAGFTMTVLLVAAVVGYLRRA
jgi:putative oxidoreductase